MKIHKGALFKRQAFDMTFKLEMDTSNNDPIGYNDIINYIPVLSILLSVHITVIQVNTIHTYVNVCLCNIVLCLYKYKKDTMYI